MDFIRIGLYTKDEDYGEMLSKRLTQFYPYFFVTLLTENMLSDPNFRDQYDLVLIDGLKEALKGKYVGLVNHRNLVLLKEDSLEYKLYKYGNVREIVKHLLFIYGRLTGNATAYLPNSMTRIITFSGSRGGAGTSSIAKSTANYLVRFKEKKVLYLSLEELLFQKPNSEQKGLDEFIYYYREDRPTATYLDCYMVENIWKTWSFNSSLGKNPLKELEAKELQKLISFIQEHGAFDYICVDCGQGFSKKEEALFQIAHRSVVVYDLDRVDEDISFMNNYFSHILGQESKGKLLHIGNKFNYGTMIDEIDDKKYSYIIDYDRESFSDKLEGEPSLDLDFGKGIKLLSGALT